MQALENLVGTGQEGDWGNAWKCLRRCGTLSVTSLGSVQWALPQELTSHPELLESLEAKGAITLTRKFGMLLGRTEIFLAR